MKTDYTVSLNNIPSNWGKCRFKNLYSYSKEIVGNKINEYERLALTLSGVIKRPKEDQNGLQPKDLFTYQIVNKNDVIFKMIDLQNINTSRVGLTKWDGIVSPAYLRFTPKYKDPGYMYYYFMSLYYNNVFNNIAGNGVRSALNSKDIDNIFCPFPSIDEQNQIVSFLDKKFFQISQLISNQEKQINEILEYKRSIISNVITVGISSHKNMKYSGLEWIGDVPNNWKITRIKYLLENSEFGIKCGPFGSALTGKIIDNGDFNVYGQWNVVDNNFSIRRNTINEKSFNELLNYEVKPKDILVSMMGTIGRCTIVPDNISKGIMDTHIIKIRLDSNLISSKFFMFEYDKTFSNIVYEYFARHKKGFIMDGLNTSIIKNAYFILPPKKEQDDIVSFIDNFLNKINKLQDLKKRKINLMNDYKKSMIYELITGKKRVVNYGK